MADAIEVYHRPLDPGRPVIRIDEVPVRLVGEVRQPVPGGPGKARRYDYESRRNGTANLSLAFAPLLGRRAVRVTERRTRADFADSLRWVVEGCFPWAERAVVVTDNPNTHTTGSLYEAFLPPVARRLTAG